MEVKINRLSQIARNKTHNIIQEGKSPAGNSIYLAAKLDLKDCIKTGNQKKQCMTSITLGTIEILLP